MEGRVANETSLTKTMLLCLGYRVSMSLSVSDSAAGRQRNSRVLVEWHSTVMHPFEPDAMFLACSESFVACLSLSNSKQNSLTRLFFVVSLSHACRISINMAIAHDI